jgi:hypothetical protein
MGDPGVVQGVLSPDLEALQANFADSSTGRLPPVRHLVASAAISHAVQYLMLWKPRNDYPMPRLYETPDLDDLQLPADKEAWPEVLALPMDVDGAVKELVYGE